jgi:hypothetical protein
MSFPTWLVNVAVPPWPSLRRVDRGHPAPPEVALELLTSMQPFLEALARVYHQLPFTSRSKRGLPRSGAKLGSIRSQPGAR